MIKDPKVGMRVVVTTKTCCDGHEIGAKGHIIYVDKNTECEVELDDANAEFPHLWQCPNCLDEIP